MFAILCTAGEMTIADVAKECTSEKWIPLLVYRRINEATPIIPLFVTQDIARSFAKRNLPPPHGAVLLSQEDIDAIQSKGWIMEIMDFPKKIKDRKDITIGLEIHEFAEEPAFRTSR